MTFSVMPFFLPTGDNMNGISQLGGYGGQQLAPQGVFGGLFGAPLGGMIERGIGGMFGNSSLGGQIGQMAGGIGGGLLPFQNDPMMQAYAQQMQQQQQQQLMQQLQQLQQMQQQQPQEQQGQQQIAPQGFFGNLLGQIGQPLGGAIGGIFGQSGLGSQIGGAAGQLGRLLPFQQDPMQSYAQQQGQQGQQGQQQLAPQGFVGNLIGQYGQPAGSAIGGLFGQAGLGGQIGGIASQLGRLLPFQQDPIAQAYAQLAQQQQQIQQQMQQLQQLQQIQAQQSQQGQQGQQMAPQGFFGNLLGQVGQPLGGAIGGLFGQSGLGSQIGGAAGQLGRLLPFQMDASQQQAWSQALQQNSPYQNSGQQAYGQQPLSQQPYGQPPYSQQPSYGSGQSTVH